jgi:hypothetical protein
MNHSPATAHLLTALIAGSVASCASIAVGSPPERDATRLANHVRREQASATVANDIMLEQRYIVLVDRLARRSG